MPLGRVLYESAPTEHVYFPPPPSEWYGMEDGAIGEIAVVGRGHVGIRCSWARVTTRRAVVQSAGRYR